MAKKLNILLPSLSGLVLLLLTGCRDVSPATAVLRGNLAYGRGGYQNSILQYLEAENAASAGRDVIYYNLANVYFALGEGDAALRTWSQAEQTTDDADLLFRIAFNRGVLYYQRGRYDEAYRSFRHALKIRPTDIDAKVNLEESLSRVRSQAPSSSESSSGSGGDEEGESDRQRLLDYVRRKEAETWSSEEQPDESSVADW